MPPWHGPAAGLRGCPHDDLHVVRLVLQRGQITRRLVVGAAQQPIEQRRTLADQVLGRRPPQGQHVGGEIGTLLEPRQMVVADVPVAVFDPQVAKMEAAGADGHAPAFAHADLPDLGRAHRARGARQLQATHHRRRLGRHHALQDRARPDLVDRLLDAPPQRLMLGVLDENGTAQVGGQRVDGGLDTRRIGQRLLP
jgi:hypothetical protein